MKRIDLNIQNFILPKNKKEQADSISACSFTFKITLIELGTFLLIQERFVFYEIQHLLM